MSAWFVVRAGIEKGPLTPQQLRQLAASGQLASVDLVRREDMKSPVPARTIKGLFAVDQSQPVAAKSKELAKSRTSQASDHPPMPQAANMKMWHCVRDGRQLGPMEATELQQLAKTGGLNPTDLVWRKGMSQWTQAAAVQELGLNFASDLPPIPRNLDESAALKGSAESQSPNYDRQVTSDQNPTHSSFTERLFEGGKWAGTLGMLTGLAGDFLEPLAPINGYLCLVAGLMTAAFAFRWYKLPAEQRANWDHRIPHQALISGVFLLATLGFWYLAQALSGTGSEGVLASNLGPVRELQVSLLSLNEDVNAIKKDTSAILDETRRIGSNVEGLGKLGGLIKDPDTPADYYHNARIHELSGDFTSAFKAYAKYITFNQEFVDPIESYLTLLRTQRGHEAAVDEFARLAGAQSGNLAVEFVAMRLLSGDSRLEALERFSRQHSRFAPVLLDLANFFSEEEMPQRSGVDAEREQHWLQQFEAAAGKGLFVRYYLDKNYAEQLLADASGRAIKTARSGSTMESSEKVFLANWNEVWVMESGAKGIEFSFDQNNWKPVTGLVKTIALIRGTIDDPKMSVGSPETVFIRYLDHRGNKSQVYSLPIASAEDRSAPRSSGQPIDVSKLLEGKSPDSVLRDANSQLQDALKSIPQ